MDEARPGAAKARAGGSGGRSGGPHRPPVPAVAAIDLGTNNCRLLVAKPTRGGGFRVVDAFSRIVRLGEGVGATGRLSDAAMDRTIEALKICADKMRRRGVAKSRCIATHACRDAANAVEFVDRVKADTGLRFEIISAEEEARLGVRGCVSLFDPACDAAMVFDIGGGSTEISWVDLRGWTEADRVRGKPPRIAAWTSIPLGVVNLHERTADEGYSPDAYEAIAAEVGAVAASVEGLDEIRALFDAGRGHLLGTSGTVTSLAGVHLRLPSYDRNAIDGLWMSNGEARAVSERLCRMSFDERVREPCIGTSRAELVVYGCAIYEGLARVWHADRLRIADRGLREGVLSGLLQKPRRRRRARRRPAN